MKPFIIISILFFCFLVVPASIAEAQSNECQPIYGGGSVCPPSVSFTVTKLVQKPVKNGEFVNTLSENDPKFSPGQRVNFQIIVKNTADQEIKQIEVTDTLPEFLEFVSGNGAFNPNTKTLNITIDTLAKGQSLLFTIVAKAEGAQSLPQDKGVICMNNEVKGISKNGFSASSITSFCIEKKVLGVSVQPSSKLNTTPASGAKAAVLLALVPLGLLGFSLRKHHIG